MISRHSSISRACFRLGIVVTAIFCFSQSLAAKPLPVAVSILPQKYFVEQIAGDLASVLVMIPPGASPASYEPRPSQMTALARCRLYLAIGVGFEKAWLGKFSASARHLKIVHTDLGIKKVALPRHFHGPDHTKGHQQDPANHGHIPDPHIWLAPGLVKIQAKHIIKALAEADPQNATSYRSQGRKFIKRLTALDNELRSLLAPVKGSAFMVFHPSWGYFARSYGLVQIPIELEGKEPKPAQLQDMIKWARRHKIKAVFVQPQFNFRTAQLVAKSIGAKIIKADPLAYDWEQNLRMQARRFLEIIR